MKVVEIKFDFLMPCLYVYENDKLLGEFCELYDNQKINSICGSLETLYNTCVIMDEHFKTVTVDKDKIKHNKVRFISLLDDLKEALKAQSNGRYIIRDFESERIESL